MKKFSFVFLALFSLTVFGQKAKVEKLEKLNLTNFENQAYYPVLSSDGKVYFTKSNYQGIYSYDLKTKKIDIITEDLGSGYEFQISSDGKTIIYRKDEFINNLKYSSVIKLELPKKIKQTLVENNRFVSPAKILSGGEIATTVQSSYKRIGTIKATNLQINLPKYYVEIENQLIALYVDGTKKLLDPLRVKNYIWPSVSPDNKMLLFVAVGEGAFVSDLNGKILHRLGYANAPIWSPDGKYIAYMIDEDDGHKLLRSSVYVMHLETKTVSLIAKDLKGMYPKLSPDGKMLAFNTEDGNIYIAYLKYDSK